jgi:hypothetical protein
MPERAPVVPAQVALALEVLALAAWVPSPEEQLAE